MSDMTDSKISTSARADLVARYRFAGPVYVTRPALPPLEAYAELLEPVWERRWLTNEGPTHIQFEQALRERLGVEHLSLFCNGTIALLVALQALGIDGGDVITTPFTFPATPHVLHWNRVRPVFCDIDAETFNLDPERVEACITPETVGIMGVHVYGTPCNVEAIAAIADRHGLPVVYDAAHSFGVQYKGRPILEYGDVSVLSFHATKPFTTGEGGALVSNSSALRERVNYLKNFGIADEETVIGPGINGKMSELQAALGLLQLDGFGQELAGRRALTEAYRRDLGGVPGIRFMEDSPDVEHNYAYFPVLVDAEAYGMGRDELHAALKDFNVHARKYFYPLCSSFPCYRELPSSAPGNLPVAERLARQVLCLPLYGTLEEESVNTICRVIAELAGARG